MKKVLLFIVLLCLSSSAGVITWTAAADGRWNTTTNWDSGYAPSDTLQVVRMLNTASTKRCTLAVADVGIKSFYRNSGSGIFCMTSSRKLVVNDTFSDDGNAATTWGNTIQVLRNNGYIHVGSTVPASSFTICTVKMSGLNQVIDFDIAMTPKQLYLSKYATVTNSGASNGCIYVGTNSQLYMEDSATLINNVTLGFRLQGGTSHTMGVSDSIKGSGAIKFYTGYNNTTTSFPAFNYYGTGSIWFANMTTGTTRCTTNVTGNLNIGTNTLIMITQVNAANVTNKINLTGQTVTCGAWSYGDSAGGTGFILARDSATIFCTSITNRFNAAAFIDSGKTSKRSIGGNVTIASNSIQVPGTSSDTITDASVITSNAKNWTYNLTIKAPTKTVRLFDSLTVLNNLTVTSGVFKVYGNILRVLGSYSNNSTTDTVNESGQIFISGNVSYAAGAKAKVDSSSKILSSGAVHTVNTSGVSIGCVSSLGSITSTGNIRVDSLYLAASQSITLRSGDTAYLPKLSLGGSVGSLDTIKATSGAGVVSTNSPALAHVALQNIRFTSLVHCTTGCVDLGGNSNAVFSSRVNYRYWVSSSDQRFEFNNNWSYDSGQSGGTPYPTYKDTVFFNGFTSTPCTTSTNDSIADLRMTSGTGTFNTSNDTIVIGNAIAFSAGVTHTTNATTVYKIKKRKATISTSGKPMPTLWMSHGANISGGGTVRKLIFIGD